MFDIQFLSQAPELQEGAWRALRGHILLGSHSEGFLAPIELWQRVDYETQWIEAAQRLLDGFDRTAFIAAPFQFWWVMWSDGDRVIVQEQYLPPRQTAAFWGPYPVPYESIGERLSLTETGERVSEWELSIGDLHDFVRRRSNPRPRI